MKLLIVGGDSLTGMALHDFLAGQVPDTPAEARIGCRFVSASDLNLLQKMDVAKVVSQFAPTVVINVASYSNLELSEKDAVAARLCDEQNSLVPAVLAEVCAHLNLPLIQHSSSFVFDGLKLHPYTEEDAANPVCRYGRSKWYGERAIRDTLPTHLILRTDWVFSARHPAFFQRHIENCKQQQGRVAVLNHRFCPTPAADIARVLVSIARQIDCAAEVWGTYHYAAHQPLSQEAFVEQVLHEASQFDPLLAESLDSLQFVKQPVQLPYIANSVLNGQKLFETFGIKPRPRTTAVTAILRQIYGLPDEVQASISAPAPASGNAAVSVLPGSKTGGRRQSRKGAVKRD